MELQQIGMEFIKMKRHGLLLLMSFIIISFISAIVGFITGRRILLNGGAAKPYIQSYLADYEEFNWLRNGRALLLLDRHLMVWDTKYNRFAIFFDYNKTTNYSSLVVAGDVGIGTTNNIGIIDTQWFDGENRCLISVDTKNSYIFYNRGEVILYDTNHDGIWDIKKIATNKWYFIEGNWYPKIGENANGSIVALNGTNYNIKFNTQGLLLRAVRDQKN